MTYRELLIALKDDAANREDEELDMPVIVRISTDGAQAFIGDLTSWSIDAGSFEDDALMLHAEITENDDEHPMAGAL